MAPKTEGKVDDQAVFLWICLKLAKESGGKVDSNLLGEAVKLKPKTAEKRLWRLTKAIEAQLKASDDGSDKTSNDAPTQASIQVDGFTGDIPGPAPTPEKQAKKRKGVMITPPSVAKEKKRNLGSGEQIASPVEEKVGSEEDKSVASEED